MINKEDFEKTIEIRNDLASLAMVCPQFSGITNKTIHLEENKKLKEILTGKSVQEMGTSDLYKEDTDDDKSKM